MRTTSTCSDHVGTLEGMTSPPTRAVANLHLHLEYDSGLDVIAAALAAVPDGPDADEERAHVSHDITTAVSHLLDIEALTPEGSPLRVTEAAVEVLVDIEEPHDHGDDEDIEPEEALAELLEMANEFAKAFDGLDLTDDEAMLVAQAPGVAEVTGPPPVDEMPAGMTTPQLIAEWGILCGHVAEACVSVIDLAFGDIHELTVSQARGGESVAGMTMLSTRLPEEWEDSYDLTFLRRFVLTLSEMTTRVTHEWEPPSNLAQVLAMSVIFDEVAVAVEESQEEYSADEVRQPSPQLLALLRSRLLDEELVEDIFDAGDPDYAFEEWFVPFSLDERVAPYASEDTIL